MENKRNWEKELEKWENGEYESKIRSLSSKANGKSVERENLDPKNEGKVDDTIKIKRRSITREELKELNKLKAIKSNLSKVKNILELKDKLEKDIENIKQEQTRRSTLKALNDEKDKLENENADLLLQAEELNLRLKDKDLTPEERTKINEELDKNIENRKINNDKFRENQNNIKNGITQKTNALVEKSDEELELMSIEMSTKVSKCNMACNNLMQGKSWNEIEMKLDNWDRKETLKGKKEEMKKIVKAVEPENKKENELRYEESIEKGDLYKDAQYEKTEETQLPVEYKSFAERHPILGKIPFLSRIVDRFNKNKIEKNISNQDDKVQKELNEIEEQIGKEVEQIMEEKAQENSKGDDFKKYLREVAEKGLDGIEQEKTAKSAKEKARKEAEKQARMAAKKEQFQETKKDIASEYAQKYGGRYETQDRADLEDEGPEL